MKKIIVSAAVAAMALSTSAFALEDIKVNGQAKVYYETNNGNDVALFNKDNASAEVVFKLGMTGKQGDVGFGATIYQTSTMGLEGTLVMGTRSGTANSDMFVGEAYITAPIAPKTVLKFGKQELDTPLAFTERWNAVPNTFDAAVAINNSIDNVTIVGAYIGAGTGGTPANNKFETGVGGAQQYAGGAYALAALYNANGLGVNFWAYHIDNVGSTGFAGGGSAVNAVWIDAAMKVADINIKAYAAMVSAEDIDATSAVALSAATKLGNFKVFGAAAYVTENDDKADLSIANTATGGKKTKLPTAGVYTDGKFVAMPGSTSLKAKGATKIGATGLALQAVYNNNTQDQSLDAMELDLIISQKVGVFNLKGILMHRDWTNSDFDKDAQQHVRVIASVNF